MNVVVCGLGKQGRAALLDLCRFSRFDRIVAVDACQAGLDWAAQHCHDDRLELRRLDVTTPPALADLLGELGRGVLIDMLPIQFIGLLAQTALDAGWHFVNTYYTTPELQNLASAAQARGLTILPEFGFDPGIDLVLAGQTVKELDTVTEFYNYGAGFPEPTACTNPLKYKVTWNFEGVLNSYYRAARIITHGQVHDIGPEAMLQPRYRRQVPIDSVGHLEAAPNGNVCKYTEMLGLTELQHAARYVMRWPGHFDFWLVVSELGLLADKNIELDGRPINQRRVLAQLIEPRLQYTDRERDIAVIIIEVAGHKDGRPRRIRYQMIDQRDLETGLMAMNRTVGFTAAIGADMIAAGDILPPGLINPIVHVPCDALIAALRQRGISVDRRALPDDQPVAPAAAQQRD